MCHVFKCEFVLKMAVYVAQYLFNKDRQLYKRTISTLRDHWHYCIR